MALIKPQFEAGRERLGGGGVVRDPAVHRAVLHEICAAMPALGVQPVALTASPLTGPAGNREFLVRLRREGKAIGDEVIEHVLSEGPPS